MKVVAILPAKGTSSRIESKNLKLLNGKPLFVHTLEKLLKIKNIDEVYVDSESDEILNITKKYGGKTIKRDVSLANNQTDGNRLFMNGVENVDADIYVQILGTSPFIEEETIEKGIEKLKNSKDNDSAVLVNKEKFYTWNEKGPIYDINNVPNSVDLEESIIETMGLYIIKKEAANKLRRRIGDNPLLLEAKKIETVDIDYPEDFEMAEYISRGKEDEEIKRLELVSKMISSSLLSDLADDLNLKVFIEGLKPNIEEKKILGRASTLKLRKLEDGEDFRGIYKGLNSYQYMRRNTIIVVDNSETENAYFGGLNATLAKKVGSSGAIVYGKTRDENETKDLDFPVFSKGYTSRDVRRRATVESIDHEITIQGVKIKVDDLIFADKEGVVVIPKDYEKEILEKALRKVAEENSIRSDIINDLNIEEIIERNGEF